MIMKKLRFLLFGAATTALLLASCGNGGQTLSGLDPVKFDTVINEKPVKLYTLTNQNNMEVCITNYGGRIVSLMAKDRNGAFVDVVLGFDNIAQYADTTKKCNFGAIMGRMAGDTWQNEVFDAEQIDKQTLKLTLASADGVKASAIYKLTDDNALDCTYEATTDQETVVNMSNATYFTLTGDPSQAGTNMVLRVYADKFLPIDTTFTTTGDTRDCYGSSMDFSKGRALFELIGDTTEHQIKIADGFNHNYLLNSYKDGKGNEQMIAASLYAENTGIFLEMFTNEPTLHLYTANDVANVTGKNGTTYPKHVSVSLAGQKMPISSKKDAPKTNLKPGETYTGHTIYRFSTK